MPSPIEPNQTRREFFRRSLRRAVLAGLAATGAILGTRRLRDPQTCVNQGLCRGCGVFDGCGLPQAVSAKQHLPRATVNFARPNPFQGS